MGARPGQRHVEDQRLIPAGQIATLHLGLVVSGQQQESACLVPPGRGFPEAGGAALEGADPGDDPNVNTGRRQGFPLFPTPPEDEGIAPFRRTTRCPR